jgi:hypothetical protein
MMYSPGSLYDGADWQRLRDRIAPWIGERAVTLFAYALALGGHNGAWSSFLRDRLMDAGDDPETPQVTETEQLLIDWGRLIAAGESSVPSATEARLDRAFSPERRESLLAFATAVVDEGARVGKDAG